MENILKKNNDFPEIIVKDNKSLENQSDSNEVFDTINKNLQELTSAEKPKREWLMDYYYFVLDTNVLIRYMDFLDDLLDMKLCSMF